MFKENDVVVYNRTGVCVIEKIEEKSFLAKNSYDSLCYVLKPVFDRTSTVFVPVNNEKLVSLMRPVLKKEDIDRMLAEVRNEKRLWIEEQRARTQDFRHTLADGINKDLIIMVNCILEHKKELTENGKRLCASDDEILKEAKREVGREFSYSLGINQDEVENYITEKLNA